MDMSILDFWPTFVATTLIALIHLLAPGFRFMWKPGNPWLPASAGVAVAYSFMDIFPHLAKVQKNLEKTIESDLYGFLAHHVYLLALLGFIVYLGIVLSVARYRQDQHVSELTLASVPLLVKVECHGLAAYNFLIGYLLSEQLTHRPEPVMLFALAIAIHFAGVDCLLREHYPILYDRTARFIFIAGIYAGWAIGVLVEVPNTTLAFFYSFLAGGIIAVATVYELPGIQSWRQYRAFCVGALVFSALIIAAEYFGN